MQIQIERAHVGALVKAFPELSALQDQLKLGSTARLPFHQLTAGQLGFLHDLYLQAGTAMAGRAAQIATLQRAVNDDGERFDEGTLEQLVPAIARFLAEPGLRGWLYRANSGGKALPWLVTRIDYTPPGEEETGRVLIELKANSMGKLAVATVTLLERDIVGRRLAEIFAAKGFLRETTELLPTTRQPRRSFSPGVAATASSSPVAARPLLPTTPAPAIAAATGRARAAWCYHQMAAGHAWSTTRRFSKSVN